MIRYLILLLCVAAGLAGLTTRAAAQPQAVPQAYVTIGASDCAARFDPATGDLASIGAEYLSTLHGEGLWQITTWDGRTISNRDFTPLQVSHRKIGRDSIVFTYVGAEAEIEFRAGIRAGELDAALHVTKLPDAARYVALPASLDFDPARLDHVIYPSEQGIKLMPSFYTADSTTTKWQPEAAGEGPLEQIAGLRCALLPVTGRNDRVTVDEQWRDVIGEELCRWWESMTHVVARPPVGKPDFTVLDSEKGAFLAGHRVEKGVLWRFGGKISGFESEAAVKTVRRILLSTDGGTLHHFTGRPVIAVLDIAGCPDFNGWSETSATQWIDGLSADSGDRPIPWEIVRITGMDELLATLNRPDLGAVVNPYGENMALGYVPAVRLTGAIRDYLTGGGIWVESGGYPFFHWLRPLAHNRLEDVYPYAFADFFRIEGNEGRFGMYGVQDARDTTAVLVPMRWSTWGDEQGGHIGRQWQMYIDPVKGGTTPVVRFTVGRSIESDVAGYRTGNGFARPLTDKMDARTLETWRRSLLVKYGGPTLREEAEYVQYLPGTCVVHVLDFLHGGFDKEYPDHLPPHPSRGTMADFSALIDTLHNHGHLFMPYTNHTWWCDDPRGEWFAAHGEGAVSLDHDGRRMREDYGGAWGWTVSPWHADVAAAERMLARQFSDLGSDILFQDQSGARGWIGFDFNPAAPAPHAYLHGWVNLSEDASRYRPLSTEQGFDRMILAQSQFAGLTWRMVPFKQVPFWLSFWLRGYRDVLNPEDFEAFPLTQMITAGDAFFTHHLGDPMATWSGGLAWSMLLGNQMFANLKTEQTGWPEYMAWLEYLSAVQRHIAYYYMGVPPTQFAYLAGSGNEGVISAQYGEFDIIANFTDTPYPIDGVTIAPQGFRARSPEAEAGYLLNGHGQSFETPRYMFRQSGKEPEWFDFAW